MQSYRNEVANIFRVKVFCPYPESVLQAEVENNGTNLFFAATVEL